MRFGARLPTRPSPPRLASPTTTQRRKGNGPVSEEKQHPAGKPASPKTNAGTASDPVVLSLGETLIDLIASDGATSLKEASTFQARPGGAPANVAVALARLSDPSAFAGVVGADPFGERLHDSLIAERVDVSRLRSTPQAETTLAFAWKDARGDGHFRLLRGADTLLDDNDIEAAAIQDTLAIVVGSVALAGEPSRAAITSATLRAAQAKVPVCFDVNVRPSLWPNLHVVRDACLPILRHATLVKMSLDDARFLFTTIDPATIVDEVWSLRSPRPDDARLSVVLTDGAQGCWYASPSADEPVRHVPAFPVEAVEPTGAGDAFTAALISRLIAGHWGPLEDADVRYAAAAGAFATTRPGAWDGLPTLAELNRFISEQ